MGKIGEAVRSLPTAFSEVYSQRCEQAVCEVRTVSMYTPASTGGTGWRACAMNPRDDRLVQIALRAGSSTSSHNTLVGIREGKLLCLHPTR